MSDDADRAEQHIENMISDGLAKVRRRMESRELDPCGACHFCGEDVNSGRLFCSRECSDDWEKAKRR